MPSPERRILEILQAPHPILTQRCVDAEPGPFAHALIRDMFETCEAHHGLGLAAPQVGHAIRIVVVVGEPEGNGRRIWGMLNPRITKRNGIKVETLEACLSIGHGKPRTRRMRSASVVVEGIDDDGTPMRITAKGVHAFAWQHEIDHLEGRLLPIDVGGAVARP